MSPMSAKKTAKKISAKKPGLRQGKRPAAKKKAVVAAAPAQLKGVTLEKAYEPKGVEGRIYAAWEKSGYFNPDKLPGKRATPFTIMMPPPNRTGILHTGHATFIALQDIMIRFERMRGKKALWVPGTDHAAISTQVKVEQLLIKEGIKNPRTDLGREKFLERVVAFAEESGKTIVKQTRAMGASCDWSREAYTFDAPRNRAVVKMFRMMYEDGIIERGNRIVNWDPQFRTTLSDDEVLTKETTAKFLTFSYDKDFPIVISTTRPETKFGDVAVAVHPDDARYAKYVGKTFEPTFCGKKLHIKVIADKAVDPGFGTGALGVTPAHSMIDAEMAERHGLDTVQVIGEDGRMNAAAGKDFAGLTVVEARAKVEEMLRAAGVLVKVEEIPQNLPVAERGGAPVEQLPMRQWFVRVNKPFALRQDTLGKWKKGQKVTLKQLMAEAVRSEQIAIIPGQFEKVYFHWIDNLRDWCISRQIWFGHRVPVWYKGDEQKVSAVSLGQGWEQDPDTLDTWFSSGTWTFSALGWPSKTADLATYHPTDVLETGRDIIFFWVARMILMSTYALGEVPFRTVYLHGLVRDEQGRKMSKSLGNVIDPRDVAEKYGTDAVRLSLVIGMTPGADTRLGEEKIASYRNFTNKLWNISRFILMTTGGVRVPKARPLPKTLADKWLLGRLDATIVAVTRDLETFNFSHAGETLRDFTWDDLADWYLEIAKIEGGKDAVLSFVLDAVLKLWHPYMPFVTEEIYQRAFLAGAKPAKGEEFLMVQAWPTAKKADMSDVDRDFGVIRDVITSLRSIRATYKVEPSKKIDALLVSVAHAELLALHEAVICGLARVEKLEVAVKNKQPEKTAGDVVSGVSVFVPLGALVDFGAERERLVKELADVEKYVELLGRKLENADFVARAPAPVVAGEREKLAAAKDKALKLKEQIATLG
jgi:valyl-tRNA synthetase